MAIEKESDNKEAIEPGMIVEASEGDLGEEDVSKPKVTEVVRDDKGHVEEVVVEKGIIFKKELEIPADRIQEVDPDINGGGKIVVDAREMEIEALNARGGHEKLVTEDEKDTTRGRFDTIEEALPTAEGLRQLEAESQKGKREPQRFSLLGMLGPGFLGGMAGNDSSAVAAYSIDGAQNGFGHLWLLLLATPLYQAVMYACAKIGRITQRGFADVLRTHYGRSIALSASLVLIVANIALITADLVAIGSGLQLITGIDWTWFVIPVAAILWYLTVYTNFDVIKQIFIVMSLAFIVYIVTAFLAHPNWTGIAFNTFVPHIDLNFASVSSAVALLGATISPYNIFWQVQGEKEEKRPGTVKQKLRLAALDLSVGVISGNLIAYFIIITTATTLFTAHKSITTAADAAQALVPILGPFAKYLFAIGFIGAGLVAIPVLLAGTSYAVSGSLGWPAGLSKKPWQNEGFYLILTVALLISLVLALLHLNPIQLLFWANVLSGVLSPVLVVFLLLVGNNRKIMGSERLGVWTNIGLVVTVLVMTAAAILLFYGLFTGQGG